MFADLHQRYEGGNDLFGDARGIIDIGDVLQDDDELVTAQPRHRVGRPHGAAQAVSHFLEQFVADLVTERVVDDLETVEVEKHHRDAALAARRLRQRMLQAVVEQRAVGQSGQYIVVRQVPDALLGLQALEHLILQFGIGGRQLGGALRHPQFELLVSACAAPRGRHARG